MVTCVQAVAANQTVTVGERPVSCPNNITVVLGGQGAGYALPPSVETASAESAVAVASRSVTSATVAVSWAMNPKLVLAGLSAS